MPQQSEERGEAMTLNRETDVGPAAKITVVLNAAAEDRKLVDRCLAGDQRAWQQLYRQCHGPLLRTITAWRQLKPVDTNLTEEIAAQVWCYLVENDGRRLATFDPNRGKRLVTFVCSMARNRALTHLRADRIRRSKELDFALTEPQFEPGTDSNRRLVLDEFLTTLTPRERRFYDDYLAGATPDTERLATSPSNERQLRHRVRSKLRAFLHED